MPAIAILPWGDSVEDFLDPLGIGLEGLRDEMSGGWLFGVVEALGRVGVEATLVVVSRSVSEVVRWRHGPTGAPLVVLPSPGAYRALRRTVAGRLAATTYLVPPISILLGWLWLGESPAALAYLGGALCLLGVGFSRRK